MFLGPLEGAAGSGASCHFLPEAAATSLFSERSWRRRDQRVLADFLIQNFEGSEDRCAATCQRLALTLGKDAVR